MQNLKKQAGRSGTCKQLGTTEISSEGGRESTMPCLKSVRLVSSGPRSLPQFSLVLEL